MALADPDRASYPGFPRWLSQVGDDYNIHRRSTVKTIASLPQPSDGLILGLQGADECLGLARRRPIEAAAKGSALPSDADVGSPMSAWFPNRAASILTSDEPSKSEAGLTLTP